MAVLGYKMFLWLSLSSIKVLTGHCPGEYNGQYDKVNAMKNKRRTKAPILIYPVAALLIVTGYSLACAEVSQEPLEAFKKGERVLILAPHPDDEAIACAGVIQEALSSQAKVKVALLTNGEHNEFAFIVYEKRITFRKNEFIHMGDVRRQESIKAMSVLGLKSEDLIFLGYPDFGTFSIFAKYWSQERPYRSWLTRISDVPYDEAVSPGAEYLGENILKDLEQVILEYKPDKIFVSHPFDVNVDHKSLYLFLQVALADLKGKFPSPKVYPYLVHHRGWPLPRHYHPKLKLGPPKGMSESGIQWFRFELSPEQQDKKHKAILCYKSQTESSAFYLLAFARSNELFGEYPVVNLGSQPRALGKNTFFLGLSRFFQVPGPEDDPAGNNIDIDLGQVTYGLSGESLLVKISKPQHLIYRFFTMTYLFGYSYSKPFADMPKIRVVTKHDDFRVFDGKEMIKTGAASLELGDKELTLKIPLGLLGNPDFILTSTNSYTGKEEGMDSAVYTSGFRRININ
jgi:LmbE family N-acetylglucosaminyl deacetylase